MSETIESAARVLLEDERASLLRQLRELGGGGEDGPTFDEGFADSSQVAAEQGENRVLAGSLRSVLADVEHALAKLDAGTYGACEVCGQPIAAARLEAMPATRFCVEHA